MIVQEDYDLAAAPVYNLARSLVRQGLLAFAVVVLVVGVLWYFVTRAPERSQRDDPPSGRPDHRADNTASDGND